MTPLLPKVLLSAVLSLFYGVMSYVFFWDLPDAWRWSLIAGLASFSILLLMMLLRDERQFRRCQRAEKLLPGQPIFMTGANLRNGKQVSAIRLYLYKEELILLNVDRKEPALTRIPRGELRRAEVLSQVEMRLTLVGGRDLLLLSPYMEEMSRQMRMQGWPATDNQA